VRGFNDAGSIPLRLSVANALEEATLRWIGAPRWQRVRVRSRRTRSVSLRSSACSNASGADHAQNVRLFIVVSCIESGDGFMRNLRSFIGRVRRVELARGHRDRDCLSFARFCGETRHSERSAGPCAGQRPSIGSTHALSFGRPLRPGQPAPKRGIPSDSFSDSYGDFRGSVGTGLLSESPTC
jgi:hypothetical protein